MTHWRKNRVTSSNSLWLKYLPVGPCVWSGPMPWSRRGDDVCFFVSACRHLRYTCSMQGVIILLVQCSDDHGQLPVGAL